MRFLLISNYSKFILNFLVALIDSLLSKDIIVHVGAPGWESDRYTRNEFIKKGVNIHGLSMGRAGRKLAEQQCSFKQVVKTHLDIYQDIK